MKLETSVAIVALALAVAAAGQAGAHGCDTAQRTGHQRARQPASPIEIVNLYNPRSESRASAAQATPSEPEPVKASFYDEYYAYRLGYGYGYGYGYDYGYPVFYGPAVYANSRGFGRHGSRDGGFRDGNKSGSGVSSGFGPGNNLSFQGSSGFGPGNTFAFGGGRGLGPQRYAGVGPRSFGGGGRGGRGGGSGMAGGRR